MGNNFNTQPVQNEIPSSFADRLGVQYTSKVSKEHKKVNGQFFTPLEIAKLMGSFAHYIGKSVRILDPGCGTAILSCALIEHLTANHSQIEEVDLVLYELDKELHPYLLEVIEFLTNWLSEKKVQLKVQLRLEDFILENAKYLENSSLFSNTFQQFDFIISNPPYFKLSINDARTIAGKIVVNGHPNIYSIFMATSAKLLKQGGELIFITPRSYASGSYFKLFRAYFFSIIEIDNVHLFVSRKDTFNRDKVLQETVIIKGKRIEKSNPKHSVIVSTSNGLSDILTPNEKTFSQDQIIDLSTNEKILYLPTNHAEESIINIFRNWSGTLNKYNIQISTGPVIAFRNKKYIQDNYENSTVFLSPLFWLHNVKQMNIEWPISKPGKGQYVRIQPETKSILIPNKNYVLLRRFSSKDDKNRLIATPYFSDFYKAEFIGVENKVNYIYRPKGDLEKSEIIGISALLNSSLFDNYFRIFNGNVNVSATELREITLPPLDLIKEIGEKIIISNDFSVDFSNCVVNEFLQLEKIINEYSN